MVVFVNINSIVISRDIIVNAISIDLELSASISGRREPKVPIPKAIMPLLEILLSLIIEHHL